MGDDLLVTVHDTGADPSRLEELTSALRRELLEHGVDDVRRVPGGPAPDGTRGIDAATAGTLLVAIAQSLQAMSGVVTVVRAWLTAAPPGRTVELTVGGQSLKLGAATAEQQELLVAEFVRAVTRG